MKTLHIHTMEELGFRGVLQEVQSWHGRLSRRLSMRCASCRSFKSCLLLLLSGGTNDSAIMAIAAAAVTAGLRKLTVGAVPETLDIVMQATGVDSVTLLSGLLRSATAVIEEVQRFEMEVEGAEAEVPNVITYVAALLYLLKDSQDDGVVERVVWTICVPLLRIRDPRVGSLQDEVIKMMVDTVVVLGLWRSMAKTLGRIYHQTFTTASSTGSNYEAQRFVSIEAEFQFLSNSCHLVGDLLESAIQVMTQQTTSSTTLDTDAIASAEYFCIVVVSKYLEPSLAFLSQPHESSLRHLAISSLLPPILRTITTLGVTPANVIRISEMPQISRCSTLQQIWDSCKILFKHGYVQRHDAHAALAAFAKDLLPPVQLEDERIHKKLGVDSFDIRHDPFFWDELKTGLAHDDPLIREQSLYVLKQAVLKPNDSKLREEYSAENSRFERWSAFVSLYKMLDEYEGFHPTEGTLMQKISFLLPFSKPKSGEKRSWANPGIRSITEDVDVDFNWMSVLFHRGFNHENIRVRQTVLRSFLELDWARAPKVKAFVTEEFVLGPFLSSLDDPMQHQDFGQGTSDLSTLAAKFIRSYSASLSERNRKGFIERFAKVFAAKAPCRAGLMSIAVCIDAATVRLIVMEAEFADQSQADSSSELELDTKSPSNEIGSNVLDSLQLVVEKSRNHFDQEYLSRVHEHILVAAAAMNQVPFMLVSKLAQFITCFPRKFLQQGGCLHDGLIKWIRPPSKGLSSMCPRLNPEEWLRRGLTTMMEEYLRWEEPTCTEPRLREDDLHSWEETAQRWTRLVAISVVSSEMQQKIVLLVERRLMETYQRAYMVPRVAEKTLLLLRCLLKECDKNHDLVSSTNNDEYCSSSRLTEYVAGTLLNTLDVLAQNAKKSAGVFWEYHGSSMLGIPWRSQEIEQKQGPSLTASAVLQGVLAITALAECCTWYCRLRSAADIPKSIINFFWDFAWRVVTSPAAKSKVGAEAQLGSFEALVTVCGAWAATVSPSVAQVLEKDPSSATVVEDLVTALGRNVQAIMRRGLLTKTQCEALACYKWSCLESLLSVPKTSVVELKGVSDSINQSESSISMSVLQDTLQEAIDSLEGASEECLVPLLGSIRWLMHWEVVLSVDSTEDAQDNSVQIMWSLVESGWATVAKYSHPRVAVWAAFLSAILHPTVFGKKEMHEAGIHEDDGPLKWLICRLISKGDSTPRAMRLTAIHMAGLWLQFPTKLACYGDQLKILVLFGEEVAHKDARKYEDESIHDEMLWRGYDVEISEAYLSSEVHAHVTIAVMLHLIAQVVDTAEDTEGKKTQEAECGAECGRKLLLDLLTHVIEDAELSKEQCKGRSSDTKRQRLRAWQMLCVLSQYVSAKEIDRVTSLLELAVENNKLPCVRRYIEAFAIRVFLRFPSHVVKHLVPVLQDHSKTAQAVSSYISIAVNVVLCTSSPDLRLDHLRQLLPAICPFMTATRTGAFTQVLVYHILQRWINGLEHTSPGPAECVSTDHSCIDRLCLQSLATHMEANADCMRLKPSVELYLDTFDPIFATTPQGVFCKQGQHHPAEKTDVPVDRVPVAVLHRMFCFLNSSRKVGFYQGHCRDNRCKHGKATAISVKHNL